MPQWSEALGSRTMKDTPPTACGWPHLRATCTPTKRGTSSPWPVNTEPTDRAQNVWKSCGVAGRSSFKCVTTCASPPLYATTARNRTTLPCTSPIGLNLAATHGAHCCKHAPLRTNVSWWGSTDQAPTPTATVTPATAWSWTMPDTCSPMRGEKATLQCCGPHWTPRTWRPSAGSCRS